MQRTQKRLQAFTIKMVGQKIRWVIPLLLLEVGNLPAESRVEINHAQISSNGFQNAVIVLESNGPIRLSLTSECVTFLETTVSSFPQKNEKTLNAYRFIISATTIRPGENTIFVCLKEHGGEHKRVNSFTLLRNDKVPELKVEPEPGSYAKMPEIRVKSSTEGLIAYSLGEKAPAFDEEGKLVEGIPYSQHIRVASPQVNIKVRAISSAGVLSQPMIASFREDMRLRGWNGLDLYLGLLQINTVSGVKEYLPSGFGGVIGARLGIDSFLSPKQDNAADRKWYMPAVWGEIQYSRFARNSFSETALLALMGPEWGARPFFRYPLLLTFGVGGGAAHASVNTPTYAAAGVSAALAVKMGVEWEFQLFSLFGQTRFQHIADQEAPLNGIALLGGILFKL